VVADGEGRNGVWLAEQGLDVLSIDFSPTALRKARALAAEHYVTVTFQQADIHTWDYPECLV
jgi:2-polyprenyl-3-methyl-5-hydroxy-6-metoxy-1,4-benzoquinol methylase